MFGVNISSKESLIALGATLRSSMHKYLCFTLISRQYDWIHGLISFNRFVIANEIISYIFQDGVFSSQDSQFFF